MTPLRNLDNQQVAQISKVSNDMNLFVKIDSKEGFIEVIVDVIHFMRFIVNIYNEAGIELNYISNKGNHVRLQAVTGKIN